MIITIIVLLLLIVVVITIIIGVILTISVGTIIFVTANSIVNTTSIVSAPVCARISQQDVVSSFIRVASLRTNRQLGR